MKVTEPQFLKIIPLKVCAAEGKELEESHSKSSKLSQTQFSNVIWAPAGQGV